MVKWEGDCHYVRYHRCYLELNQDIHVTAHFEPIQTVTNKALPSSFSQAVQFVALGDTGEGNNAQYQVAKAMRSICDRSGGCQFAIGLGDHIYGDTPFTVYNSAFETKFEKPYQSISFPFFMSLAGRSSNN